MTGQGWEGGLGCIVRAPRPHPSAGEKEDQEIQTPRRANTVSSRWPLSAPPQSPAPAVRSKVPWCRGASLSRWGGAGWGRRGEAGAGVGWGAPKPGFTVSPHPRLKTWMVPTPKSSGSAHGVAFRRCPRCCGQNPPHLPFQHPKGPLNQTPPGQDWGSSQASPHTEAKGPCEGAGKLGLTDQGPKTPEDEGQDQEAELGRHDAKAEPQASAETVS